MIGLQRKSHFMMLDYDVYDKFQNSKLIILILKFSPSR